MVFRGYVGFDLGGKPSEDPPYLDSYPSLLIAASDYVEGSGDEAWLAKNYSGLRAWAEKLLAMDRTATACWSILSAAIPIHGLGKRRHGPRTGGIVLVSGMRTPMRTRWRIQSGGMAGLAERLEQRRRFPPLSCRSRRAAGVLYHTFYNPETGVLAGWKTADGQLHDYFSSATAALR